MHLPVMIVIVLLAIGQISTAGEKQFSPSEAMAGRGRSLIMGSGGPASERIKADEFVGRGKLNPPELIRRAQRILRENERASFISAWFFETKTDWFAFFPPRPVHDSYAVWRMLYERLPADSLAVGRLLAFDGSAVLQIREANGIVSRYVLRGRDALWWNIRGEQVELLDLIETQWTLFQGGKTINVYARTGAPLTEQFGSALWRELRDRLPFEDMSLNVRQDCWFIGSWFPVYYPFDQPLRTPREAEYRRAEDLTCWENHPERTVTCAVRRRSTDTQNEGQQPAFLPPSMRLRKDAIISVPSSNDCHVALETWH